MLDPKAATNPDYPPPAYDMVGPGDMENKLGVLSEYDVVALVDNSNSMRLNDRWKDARQALGTLADIVSEHNPDGIEIHFVNKPPTEERPRRRGFLRWLSSIRKGKDRPMRIKSKEDVDGLFDRVGSPEGPTPLASRLEDITNSHILKVLAGKPHRKTIYLVMTDGRPNDDVMTSIVHLARQLDRAGAQLSQLGIQFVRVGDSEEAKEYLESLDDLKNQPDLRDIVDTEPFNSGVKANTDWEKLLLGGVNRTIDKRDKRSGQPEGSQHNE